MLESMKMTISIRRRLFPRLQLLLIKALMVCRLISEDKARDLLLTKYLQSFKYRVGNKGKWKAFSYPEVKLSER